MKAIGKDAVKGICDEIYRQTCCSAIRIQAMVTTGQNEDELLYASKFGGLPYWPADKEYPKDKEGKKMVLLAQIYGHNIKGDRYNRLPENSMLQFFISASGNGIGEENGVRVFYHENIDRGITAEDVLNQGIRTASDYPDIFLPLHSCYPITLKEYGDCLTYNSDPDKFDRMFRDIFSDRTQTNIPQDKSIGHCLSDAGRKMLWKYNNGPHHKMFGYPEFTQEEPIMKKWEEHEYIQLLQIVSEYGKNHPVNIMWGDAGVANFFITEEDFKNRNFDNVRFVWDCY